MEIVAHRGESWDAPENTLAAFRLAWELQADAIECDAHLTRDGHLVVCHDDNTRRTTGQALAIRDCTLAELQCLDAGRWKGAQWTGERLPTLADVLAAVPDHARCFVELKSGAEAVPSLASVVQHSGKRAEQLAVISFHADAVGEAKRRLPHVPAYLLASLHWQAARRNWEPGAEELLTSAQTLGADGLNLSFQDGTDAVFEQAVADMVRQVRAAGLKIYAWTVDDADAARKLVAFGVDGITTNRAAWLKAQLR